jgi:guanine deaminase
MSHFGIRAAILHFPNDTLYPDKDYEFYSDGLLIVKDEHIVNVGQYEQLSADYPNLEVKDHQGKLLLPGFIDSHLHFPQTDIIASYGKQLLDWLNNYTFPTERKFEDEEYARQVARFFFTQLLSNGTTTGAIYSTVHKQATDALFSVAAEHNMCVIAGKVCMDRNCPTWLQDTPELAQKDSAELIEKWHKNGRLHYAITPRFAPTSTDKQLSMLGELVQSYPDTYIQTHLSENKQEIEWVSSLFPNARNYLDVYDQHGLVTSRSIFGHGVYLQDEELACLHDYKATIAVCPTSNLFLGSGLFNFTQATDAKVKLSLATDVGGGTSFSLLRTMGEAYKIGQLNGESLSPFSGLYMITQGAASNLNLPQVGNLNPQTDADFVLLDLQSTPLITRRLSQSNDPRDWLFALSFLAESSVVAQTWVAGKCMYKKKESVDALA